MTGDILSALKHFRRQPTFAVGATLSLAIGMSLATAVFSIIDGALVNPIRLPDSDRLVHVYATQPSQRLDWAFLPPQVALAIRNDSRVFSDVAVYTEMLRAPVIGGSGDARSVTAVQVASNFFDVLKARPLHGRVFGEEHRLPGDRSVIIAHSIWRSRFGENPGVIGQQLLIDRQWHTIIGVMPEGFDFPERARIWFPLDEQTLARDAYAPSPGAFLMYNIVARLAGGATVEQASAEAAMIYGRVMSTAVRTDRSARAVDYADFVTRDLHDQLRIWGVAAILIAILCAVNFATMSLARGMRRRGEIALRAAMGASRSRIIRMLGVEATLLSLVSGALALVGGGLLLSFGELWFANGQIPVDGVLRWPAILFGVGASVIVGFVFAIAPAVEVAKVDLRSALGGMGATATMRGGEMRGRRALVALQLALALTAVAVVAALLQTDRRYQARTYTGFDASPIVIADVAPNDSSVRQMASQPLLDRIDAMPPVSGAAAIRGREGAMAWSEANLSMGQRVLLADVSSRYFATLGVAPLHGRLATADEIASRSDVVVISEGLAVVLFGKGVEAVGRRMRVKPTGDVSRFVTIIGVLPSIGGGVLGALGASIYTTDHRPLEPVVTIVVHVAGEPAAFLGVLARSVSSFDAGLRVSDARAARVLLERERATKRGRAIFLGSVGVLATLLAMIGVYGLTAYAMELRARELAIRRALGARAPQLARVMFAELWWMSAIGIVAGVVASARLTAFFDAAFRNPMIPAPLIRLDPVPTAAAAATLLAIMIVGTATPLRRVLRMDVIRVVQGS